MFIEKIYELDYTYIYGKGKRSTQQDFINTLPGNKNELVISDFIVCDGLGGHPKGEVASQKCVEYLVSFIETEGYNSGNRNWPFYVKNANDYVHEKLTELVYSSEDAHPDMGTTLAWLHYDYLEGIIYICWMGDSRIYHFRNGQIKYKTRDHSLINKFIESGDQKNANKVGRNLLAKVVSPQIFTTKHFECDIEIIDDVQANDFFLLCSDGILESHSDEELAQLFLSPRKISEIKIEIEKNCEVKSYDNYSAIIIKILE